MKLEGYSGAMCNKHDRVIIIIIIIIIDKTDAGLNGLCIRDITLIAYMTLSICIMTTKLYCSSQCHGDLFCIRTVGYFLIQPKLI